MRFSPSGDRIVLGAGKWVEVRDVLTGRSLWRIETSGRAHDVCWDSSGRLVASASSPRDVYVFDAADGRELHHFEGHDAEATRVGIHRSGRFVLSSGWDLTTRVWDRQTGEQVLEVDGYLSAVGRTSDRVATQIGDQIQFWELAAGVARVPLAGHDEDLKHRGTWHSVRTDDGWHRRVPMELVCGARERTRSSRFSSTTTATPCCSPPMVATS